jgi:hypothetical protein
MKNKTDFGEILISGLSHNAGMENQKTITNYVSPPCKGDGLVHRASGQHTIQIHTINANASISIEATLDRDPKSGAWIPIQLTDTETGEITTQLNYIFNMPVPGVPYSGKTVELNKFYMAVGQYSWLRANVSSITNGIIDYIKLNF